MSIVEITVCIAWNKTMSIAEIITVSIPVSIAVNIAEIITMSMSRIHIYKEKKLCQHSDYESYDHDFKTIPPHCSIILTKMPLQLLSKDTSSSKALNK